MIAQAAAYEVLQKIFSDVFMEDDIVISPSLSMKDVATWNSFGTVELILLIEERFSMKFSSAELDNLKTVEDIVRIVSSRGVLPAGS